MLSTISTIEWTPLLSDQRIPVVHTVQNLWSGLSRSGVFGRHRCKQDEGEEHGGNKEESTDEDLNSEDTSQIEIF